MNAAIIWDEAYAEHDTGAHPEGADRVTSLVEHLEGTDLWPRLTVAISPEPATEDDVLLVHTPGHLAMIKRAARGRGAWLDPDTHVSPRSYETRASRPAARCWPRTCGRTASCRSRSSARPATTRPRTGRWASASSTTSPSPRRGSCSRATSASPILDWDVHHGNGTQAAFYAEPRVLFGSAHQWPLYPGSGFFTECGEGAGEGYTVNVPLPAGADDGDYASLFDVVFAPVVRQFAPQAILVSAGQDIHRDDPLGGMAVTEAGFAHMSLRCLRLAQELCEGRLAFVLEGGYDRGATARAVEAVLRAVLDEEAPAVGDGSERAAAAIARAREVQSAYWDL